MPKSKYIVFLILIISITSLMSCEKASDTYRVSIENQQEDTISIIKYFASNGAVHNITILPGQTQFMYERTGTWEGIDYETRMRYDSLIIATDSLRILISEDSSKYFIPNPFTDNNGWKYHLTEDEEGESLHEYYLSVPYDSILINR